MTKIRPKRVLTVCEAGGLSQVIGGFSQNVFLCIEQSKPEPIGGKTFEVVDKEYADLLEREIEQLKKEIKKLTATKESE